jgi:hypothetical protein
VLAGEDAVEAAGDPYLSRVDGQTDAKFAAYVKRASLFTPPRAQRRARG